VDQQSQVDANAVPQLAVAFHPDPAQEGRVVHVLGRAVGQEQVSATFLLLRCCAVLDELYFRLGLTLRLAVDESLEMSGLLTELSHVFTRTYSDRLVGSERVEFDPRRGDRLHLLAQGV